MKLLALAVAALNLALGLRAALQALHVLDTAKYAQGTTVTFALLFLALGGCGLYAALAGPAKTALWIGVAPWALGVAVLFVTMVTSSQQ